MKRTPNQDELKQVVVDYFNDHVDKTDNFKLKKENVFVVWFSKTLQNCKALISTTVPDGMYYELTYNGDKQELYLDAYKKLDNKCIKLGNNREIIFRDFLKSAV